MGNCTGSEIAWLEKLYNGLEQIKIIRTSFGNNRNDRKYLIRDLHYIALKKQWVLRYSNFIKDYKQELIYRKIRDYINKKIEIQIAVGVKIYIMIQLAMQRGIEYRSLTRAMVDIGDKKSSSLRQQEQ